MTNQPLPRREFLKSLSGAAAAASASNAAATPPDRPNIIMIFADDLDFDEIGWYDATKYPCYGGAHHAGIRTAPNAYYKDPRMLTPHIDSLGRGGVTFSRFYISSPVCTPSRYSVLAGRYASRSEFFCRRYPPGTPGMIQWNTYLEPNETNVARELHNAGYATGVVGKWHLGMGTEDFLVKGLNDDVDPFDPKVTARIRATYDKHLRYIQDNFGWDYAERIYFTNQYWLGIPRKMIPHNLEWVTEGALEFIQQNHQQPFFLYMPLTLPHGQYSSGLLRGNPRFTPAGVLDKAPDVMLPRATIFERLREEGIDPRNAAATWIDDSVGAIMKKLDELGIAENTLLIFTSDHGSRGKYTCYEAARIPFVARWPRGIKPGTTIDSICANIDLAPTFLELAGARPPAEMVRDGASFLPMLQGAGPPADWRESLYLEVSYIRGVVTDNWKYIANRPPEKARRAIEADALEAARKGLPRVVALDGEANPHPGGKRRGIRYHALRDFPNYFHHDQLYDLDNDLFEQSNLACDPSFRAISDEMRSRLTGYINTLPHTFGEFKKS